MSRHMHDPHLSDSAGTAARSEPVLTARGLVKHFGEAAALVDASLEVYPGEIVAVMGPSGSGKSTLLHCVSGILPPDAGQVHYGEHGRIETMSDEDRSTLRRTDFGFVFQFGQLIPELTCVENVALPLRLTGTRRHAAEREAIGRLDALEAADVARKRPGEVSGGQAQRVALARAMVTKPRVIFGDEPTGALDSLTSERVMYLLSDAAREHSTAVVLVTHEARIAAFSHREVSMRDGRTRQPERIR